MAFRSVPRPSSPPGTKASTERPSHAHSHADQQLAPLTPILHRNHPTPCRPDLSERPAEEPIPIPMPPVSCPMRETLNKTRWTSPPRIHNFYDPIFHTKG